MKTKLIITLLLSVSLLISCNNEDVIDIPLTKIELNKTEIQLGLGEVFKVVVDATPKNSTSPKIIWSSSNVKVVQVQSNSNGLVAGVKGISTGESIITAKLGNDGAEKNIKVTVQRIYCDVTGTGLYNAVDVKTSGGSTNITHSGLQPSGNFEFYKDEKLSVNPNGSFTLEIVQSNNWSRTMVWIDWSGDGNFTGEGEQVAVFGLGNQLNDGPFSATIDVPTDAAKGMVRMRIVTGDAWTYNQIPISVCGELANSTTKDFNVDIL